MTTTDVKPAQGAYPGTSRLAVTLAAVSGYIDGVGATLLAGLFVSFMSGNTTSTGLALGQGQWARAGHFALPIALYVLGSVLGALLLGTSPRGLSLTYGLSALLLALFAWLTLAAAGQAGWQTSLALLLLVWPMAMVNVTLRHVGSASVGLGYVTGTLVSLSESLATAISRKGRNLHQAHDIWLHLGLWMGFVLGATLGAFVTHRWSSWAVTPPILILLLVAARAAQHPPPRPADL